MLSFLLFRSFQNDQIVILNFSFCTAGNAKSDPQISGQLIGCRKVEYSC